MERGKSPSRLPLPNPLPKGPYARYQRLAHSYDFHFFQRLAQLLFSSYMV
jgi:hypothetical protein